jgi:CheY-like chemotaxis protein
MDTQPFSDELSPPAPEASGWTAARLSELMTRHGVPVRHQAAEIAQICTISISQARRKLRGAVWLFDEVLAVCRHFDETLDTVLADPVMQAGSSSPSVHKNMPATPCPAHLLVDGLTLPCDILLGARHAPHSTLPPCLLATQGEQGWVVGSAAQLTQRGLTAPRYHVDHLQLQQVTAQARARIAVLDDDQRSAEALTDWFNEVGYQATAYTRTSDLLATPLSHHDAFVVDLILAGGQTSEALIERIRQEQPQAPIVLLTGQLRDGTASEATLATMLRTQGVTFFEKPVRPAVLTAAIQSNLDRLTTPA